MSDCVNAAAQSTLDYLRYLKETASKTEKVKVVSHLIKDRFKYSFDVAQLDFTSHGSLPIQDDEELTLLRLGNFSMHLEHVKDYPNYLEFLKKIKILGYFRGLEAGDIMYLNKFMAATYVFFHKLKDCNDNDPIYSNAIFALTGRKPTDKHVDAGTGCLDSSTSSIGLGKNMKDTANASDDETDEEGDDDYTALKTASIWDDIDIALFKPAKFMVIDSATTLVDDDIDIINKAIDARARCGPDLLKIFLMASVSFAGVFIVAGSSSICHSPLLYRLLWAVAFGMNLYAVTMPGRLDRMFKSGNHLKPWHSLFEPAPWAFSIWAVIYVAQGLLTGLPPEIFQAATPYWLAANWFCVLWCFCFRAEFKNHLWVPLLCLYAAAACFTGAHIEITRMMRSFSHWAQWGIVLLRLPMALHAAWMISATFITLNSWVAVSRGSKGLQVAVAFGSAFMAAVAGLAYAVLSVDPTIALVVAWALDGCACRTLEKAHVPQSFVSQDIHEALSITESLLSNALKIGAGAIALLPLLNSLQEAIPAGIPGIPEL